ncbi:MAG: hypothetical protein RI932_1320 [Pseudomonadota bacterium]
MEKVNLKKVCNETVKPSGYLDYREYLEAVFAALKEFASEYTYFDFAEDAGLGRNNLMNALIRNRRPLTPKTAKKIVQNLGLVGRERQYFEALVEHAYARDPIERESILRKLVVLKGSLVASELDRWQLDFFSHWSNAVLLELMNQEDSTLDPEWFQAQIRPKITVDEVRNGLELLCRIGYAKRDDLKSKYIPLQSDVSTGAEVASVALIRYHQTLLDLARAAVVDVPSDQREINSLVLSVTQEEFEVIKANVQEFSQRIFDGHPPKAPDSSTRVVQVSMQVFPLTRHKGEKK